MINGLEIDTKQRVCLPISIFDNKLDRESINPLVVLFFSNQKVKKDYPNHFYIVQVEASFRETGVRHV